MSNKPKQTTEQTVTKKDSTKGPLDAQMPLYSSIWDMTQNAIGAAQPQNFVAGPNQVQRNAVSGMIEAAPMLGSNAMSLKDMAGKVAGGYFLDPNNDPTFAAAANAAISPITAQLTDTVLPAIVDASIRNGGVGGGPAAYGGARQDLQENDAVADWASAASDVTAKMAMASRQAGLNLLPQAGAMDQAANLAMLAPSTALGLAGGQMQEWEQGGLMDTIQRYLFPLQGAGEAAKIASTGGFYSSTENSDSTTTKTTPAPDMATQWLQGITGGLGIASSLMGMPGMGAMFSGLGGMFGGGGMGGNYGLNMLGLGSKGPGGFLMGGV